ncbi:carbonic anhydrase 1-like isoform X2 [Corticium candelabrum]|uniref:carbonic anhydrase 1-like isoform X2 n=1 Tax=Corticium candelabrum TaxID=121492 RepID=UPI002E273B5A|nr:carbonic anhydrase 1-like isoform X2 [Corticium candelabrum]
MSHGHSTTWDYSDGPDQIGPSQWKTQYPAANGQHQSPIDLKDQLVNRRGRYGPIMTKLAHENSYLAENNGHTVKFTPKTDLVNEITGGPLTEVYRLDQFHFHWGQHNHEGSEHQLNSHAYAAEAHFVFVNTDLYCNEDNPASKERGLAVLGVLLQVGDHGNEELYKLVECFKDITLPGQQAKVEKINISSLFPEQKDYYTYNGSLTTPPCYESVTWSVFHHPITISPPQLDEFRKLLNEHNHQIAPNFRPIQEMNGRLLCRSFIV